MGRKDSQVWSFWFVVFRQEIVNGEWSMVNAQ